MRRKQSITHRNYTLTVKWRPPNFHPIGLLLTAAEYPGLLRAVRRIIKHFVIATLFAVSMLGGGELPILHASEFAGAHPRGAG